MGQSRLQALVMVTTGRRIFCVWLSQGPQSKGQPWSTCFLTAFGATRRGSVARVCSYHSALFDNRTSCSPCDSHALRIQTSPFGSATTRAVTAFLQTLHRLVV